MEKASNVLPNDIQKKHWSKEEDEILKNLVEQNGTHCWLMISKYLIGRTPKQCRERWSTYVSPEINNNPWTSEEDSLLIHLHSLYGNKWAKMKSTFSNRTASSIKNRWNWLNRRKDSKITSNIAENTQKPRTQSDHKIDFEEFVNFDLSNFEFI